MYRAATFLLLALSSPAFAQSVWVAPSTAKIRPGDAPGTTKSISLEAARNEFEAVHVVVDGGASGAKAITVTAGALTGPGGATLADVRVSREAWYNVTTLSNIQGALGRWPDALIPSVDTIDNQPRNAFPYDVPAHEQQPILVDYHVPSDAPAGWYTGAVHVSGGVTADVPVQLYVHAFSLPSTASLRSAYSLGWNDACIAHYGGYTQCGGDPGVQALNLKYSRFALDYRVTISDAVYTGPSTKPDGSYDWATFDATYAPYFDGTSPGRLTGAKLTSSRYPWVVDSAHYAAWAQHFRARGWLDRAFDYTCDEPPDGCSWSDIATRAATVHAGDPQFETLVTTTLALAQQNGVAGSIDTFVAVINWLDPLPPDTNTRASYDPFLAASPQHHVWSYEACMSDGCNNVGGPEQSGWPSHIIDAPAAQNRSMEWEMWREHVSGELYYDTTYAFARGDAWVNQFYFGGNGDGTLFYPGTPAKIGGTTNIPVASLRLVLMREGMEDYEYFKALADAGDPAMADAEAAGLSPHAWTPQTDPAAIDAARHRMALRIEALTGQTPPPMGSGPSGNTGPGDMGTTPAPDMGGTSGGTSGGTPGDGSGATGGNGATDSPAPPMTGIVMHGGCSLAGGHGPLATPLSLALLAAVALLAVRRRAD